MQRSLFIIITIAILSSCQGDTLGIDYTSICVEGWIEHGEHPIVLVSEVQPPNHDYRPIDEAYTHPLHNAQVSLMAGGEHYEFEERYCKDYNPPYIYTCEKLVGQEGMKYELKVIYGDTRATATTTIPSIVSVDSITADTFGNDGDFSLVAHLTDVNGKPDWYKAFVRVGEDGSSFYLSSFLSTVCDKQYPEGHIQIPIYRGRIENGENYTPFFQTDEMISVKICHIDSIAYHYWNEYDKMLVLSHNPILSYQTNLPGNVRGGLGYWFGYGSQYITYQKCNIR